MSRFIRALVAMVAVVLMVATAQPWAQDKKEANVTGTWNVMVKGSGAHGDLAATMILKAQRERFVILISWNPRRAEGYHGGAC